MLRLRRVHIHKYRGVLPGEELRFGPEAVFVLGRNGAGKTTFLELLTRLVLYNLRPFVKEGGEVDVEWEVLEDVHERTLCLRYVQTQGETLPNLGDRVNAPTPEPSWRLEGWLSKATAADGDSTPLLRFELYSDQRLRVEQPTSGAAIPLTVDGGSELVEHPLVQIAHSISYHGAAQLNDGEWAGSIAAEVFNFVSSWSAILLTRFDEALEIFRTIVVSPERSEALPTAELQSFGQYFGARFIPRELSAAYPRTKPFTFPNQVFTPDTVPEGSRFLAPLFEAFGALEVELRPRLVEQDERGRSLWRQFDVFVVWPGGLKQRHDHLSFGQKRMLAFLWYQAASFGVPVFTDELTNGLHSAWARQITDLLAGRQAFHAVQNPLMLDMAGLGAEEEIPSRFVLCEIEVSETGRRWSWRNPTAEEAHELHVAWDAGFEDLSKILINRGLW